MFEVNVKNVTHLCKKRVGRKEGRGSGSVFYVDNLFN